MCRRRRWWRGCRSRSSLLRQQRNLPCAFRPEQSVLPCDTRSAALWVSEKPRQVRVDRRQNETWVVGHLVGGAVALELVLRVPYGERTRPISPGSDEVAASTNCSWPHDHFKDSFTLYLKIFRGADGALMGAFRNSEQNSYGGAMQFFVSRDGNAQAFRARADRRRRAQTSPRCSQAESARSPWSAGFRQTDSATSHDCFLSREERSRIADALRCWRYTGPSYEQSYRAIGR